jgi:HEAT repeat protein
MTAIGPQCVPILAKALKAKNVTVRRGAGLHLWYFPRQAAHNIEAILKAANDSDPAVRAGVLATLARIKAASGEIKKAEHRIVPVLIKALKDPDAEVRAITAWSLETIGPPASAAIPALIEAITAQPKQKPNELASTLEDMARYNSIKALGSVGRLDDRAVAFFIKTVKAPGVSTIRGMAALELSKLGKRGREALPVLIRLFKEDENLQVWLLRAFDNFGPNAKEAVPAIVKVFKERKGHPISWKAAVTLGRIGPSAKEALPALREALKDNDEAIRTLVAETIKRIQGKN